jgi:hypothetical protein
VEFGGLTPPHLLKECSAHKDNVEIKCMGSVGGKTPTEPKIYLHFSNLRLIEHDEDDVYILCLFLTWVSMNEAF